MKLKLSGTGTGFGKIRDAETNQLIASDVRHVDAVEIIRRVNAHDALVEALNRSQELFEKALPKFNWGSSILTAEAIRLLNEVPIEVANALAAASETRTNTTPDAKTGINEKDIQ